jgi:adenylate cyclase
VIGLDIVFAESDRSSPHRLSLQYPEHSNKLENYYAIFAKCLSQTPVIGGYTFTFEKTDEENFPMLPAVIIERGQKTSSILEAKGIVLNIEMLQDSMYSSGFFNNIQDEGGMIRSVPLVMRYDNALYTSLPLEMLRVYSGATKVEVVNDDGGVRSVEFGEFKVPTDRVGRLSINFRGGARHFQYISVKDILSGNFKEEDVANKFILVGTSALGLMDLRSIPFDATIAGVEVHANAIDNILKGDFLHKPADMVVYDILIIWAMVSFFVLLFSYIRSWLIIPFAVVALYGLFELFFTLLFTYGVVLNLLFPFIAFALTLILSVGLDYITASRQKEEAKRMLGKKVSPAVMEYLLEHSEDDLVASREVEASIFFSDIRGFTTISEKIGSPDKLIHMLNEYMTPMVDNIVNHKGTIDKFIGDAIMAYWNAPVAVANHADKAVQSAIEQIEMLIKINRKITPKYDVQIAIGIGVHTGVVTAGDMGSNGRSDYTIIGDNVNLASRLEGLTKQYGAQILISEATRMLLKDEYTIRPMDLVEVKGKSEAVEIHEVICNNKNISDKEMQIYLRATKLFRDANVDAAYELYLQLQEHYPSTLYELYTSRCKNFLKNPDLEFTPILTMTTK